MMESLKKIPLVIGFLKTKSFNDLKNEFGVNVRFSIDSTKASLNYDQFEAKSGVQLSDECRGMVIRPVMSTSSFDDVVGDCEVVAWPMNRFYNQGDPAAIEVDWSDSELKVFEKLDGTMIVVYWDEIKNQWCSATRAVPEADLPICKDHIEIGDATFSNLFQRACVETRQRKQPEYVNAFLNAFGRVPNRIDDVFYDLDKNMTYVFELTSQFNRVIVRYTEPNVTLLSIRDLRSGLELDVTDKRIPFSLQSYCSFPKIWHMSSPEAMTTFVNEANPAEMEGAVACDSRFNRNKCKNKAWVLSSRAKDLVTVSRRSGLEAIISGTIDDVLPLLERDIANELLKMQTQLLKYVHWVDERFQFIKDASQGNRKQFALQVIAGDAWPAPYFAMWENKATSTMNWLRNLAADDRLSSTALEVLLKKLSEQDVETNPS
jgi:hypothetical protein